MIPGFLYTHLMDTKTCRICHQERALSCFSISKRGRKDSRCRNCRSRLEKERYKVYSRDEKKTWYLDLTEKECRKCFATRPIEDFSKTLANKSGRSSYCRQCRAAIHQERRLNGKTHAGRAGHIRLKKVAEGRNFPFSITPEDLTVWWATTPEICYYCGVSFEEHASFRELILSGNPAVSRFREIFSNKNHAKQIAMSVDRKVPSLGYTLNNICKACWICNYVKGGMITEEQMLWLAPQIATELRSIVAGDIS